MLDAIAELSALMGDDSADGVVAGIDAPAGDGKYKSRCVPLPGAPRVDPRTGRKDNGVQGVIVCRNDKGEVYESVTYSDGVQILKLPRGGIPAGKTLPLRDAGHSPYSPSNTASAGDQYWYDGKSEEYKKVSYRRPTGMKTGSAVALRPLFTRIRPNVRPHNDFTATAPYDPGFSPVNWQKNVLTAPSYDNAHQTPGILRPDRKAPDPVFKLPAPPVDMFRNNLPTPPPSYNSGGSQNSWSLNGLGENPYAGGSTYLLAAGVAAVAGLGVLVWYLAKRAPGSKQKRTRRNPFVTAHTGYSVFDTPEEKAARRKEIADAIHKDALKDDRRRSHGRKLYAERMAMPVKPLLEEDLDKILRQWGM